MGFFNYLFGKKTEKQTEDFSADIDGLSGTDTFLKALNDVRAKKYQTPSDRSRSWFAASLERLRANPPSTEERERIANAIVTHTGDWYQHSDLDTWFKEIMNDLSPVIRDATVTKAESKLAGDHTDSAYLQMIKFIGGERAARLFETRRQGWIDRARSEHRGDWELLLEKCNHLEIVTLQDAGDFLKNVAGVKAVARYGADTLTWALDTGRHVSNVEDVVHYGVSRTAANNGRFSQLANQAEARRNPIPHLVCAHSWNQADDAYGTDMLYVLRVADDEYVCYDKEN